MTVLNSEREEVKLNLLRSMMQGFRAVPLLYSTLCGFVALQLTSEFPPVIILIWWLATVGLQIEYAFYQARFFKQAQEKPDTWSKASARRHLLMNLLMICMVPLFWQPDNDLQNVALIVFQAVHVLIFTILAATDRNILFACTFPNVSTVIIGTWWIGNPAVTMLCGAFLLAYLFLVILGATTRKILENEYRLNQHNKHLIDDLAIARDISEAARIKIESTNTELAHREERFRALIDNAFESIIISDKEGIINYASPSVRAIGMHPDDLLGHSIFSFLPDKEIENIKKAIIQHNGQTPDGEPIKFQMTQRNGKVQWLEASITDLRRNPTVGGYVTSIRDITDRKRSQMEMVNQFRVLKALATGASISEVMELVAQGVEDINQTAFIAIYLIGKNKEITVCATPNFPDDFRQAIIELWHKTKNDDFGRTVLHGDELSVTPDLLESDHPDVIDLAQRFNLHGFWRQNFRATDPKGGGGCIVVYLRDPLQPTEWERSYLKGAVQLATIALNRRRTEQHLREATRTAELANRAKSKFLANMSHELRTPLNAIIGFSDIMKNELFGSLGSARYVDYAKDINDSGAHLLNVIDDILDISKIEAGRYPLEETTIEIADVLRWSIEMVHPRTEEKRIAVTLQVADDLPAIYGDLRAMRQIMLNLLSNAAKFTPQNGAIAVTATLDNKCMIISVSDNGIGIPADKLSAVLEPFAQVDDSFARKHDGTGLGLSITKALVTLHEGGFRLESELGKGTTAILTFPSSRLRPANTPKLAICQ